MGLFITVRLKARSPCKVYGRPNTLPTQRGVRKNYFWTQTHAVLGCPIYTNRYLETENKDSNTLIAKLGFGRRPERCPYLGSLGRHKLMLQSFRMMSISAYPTRFDRSFSVSPYDDSLQNQQTSKKYRRRCSISNSSPK